MASPVITSARPDPDLALTGTEYLQVAKIRRYYGTNVIIVSGHPLLHTRDWRSRGRTASIKEPTPGTLEHYGIIPIGEDKLGHDLASELATNWVPSVNKFLKTRALQPQSHNWFIRVPTIAPKGYQLRYADLGNAQSVWQKIADIWHWGIFPYWSQTR